MAGLCEGGNEPPGSLKAICNFNTRHFKPFKMARHDKMVILTVFIIAVVFLPSTEGFFSYNPFKRAASLFDGHEFWSQFQQG
ncbi:hypothetical protein ANN_24421 [Periplaneta americana]|uniref:Uncharacterized protein n=1 Tax=Periplaneta americana TaxID=6978 RepID=A0ABQ8S3E5_PERAM|nr:hypothetical protein ANN_24421 [Periplaneta americana]